MLPAHCTLTGQHHRKEPNCPGWAVPQVLDSVDRDRSAHANSDPRPLAGLFDPAVTVFSCRACCGRGAASPTRSVVRPRRGDPVQLPDYVPATSNLVPHQEKGIACQPTKTALTSRASLTS